MSGGWEIIAILSGIGAACLALELFLPGLILGSVGGLSLTAAVVLTYTSYGFARGTFLLCAFVLGGGLLFRAWMIYFPKTRMGRHMVLSEQNKDSSSAGWKDLEQSEGELETDCRPSGMARFQGKRYDVISENTFLPAGERVKVIKVEGSKIIIRPIQGS